MFSLISSLSLMFKKLFSHFIFVLSLFFLIMPFFGFAVENDCAVCSTSSPEFQRYIDFSEAVLGSLQPVASSQSNAGGWLVTAFSQSLKWISSAFQTTFGSLTALVAFSVQTVTWVPLEFAVLVRWKAVIRDYKKLMIVETKFTDKFLELGSQRDLMWPLDDSVVDKINSAIGSQRKSQGWFFAEASLFPYKISGSEVISLIWALNSRFKRFVVFHDISQFRNDTISYSEKTKDIYFDFDENFFIQMKQKYSCISGTMCSQSLQKFGKRTEEILQKWLSGFKKSVDVYKASLKRLKQLFSKKSRDDAFTRRQNDLMRKQYGIDALNASDSWLPGLKNMAEKMRNIGKVVKDAALDVKDFYSWNTPLADQNVQEIKSSVREQSIWTPASTLMKDRLLTDFQMALEQDMASVLASQENDFAQAAFLDPATTTALVPEISIFVYDWIDLLWSKQDKQSARSSIVKHLWSSCENQCVNVPSKCWY